MTKELAEQALVALREIHRRSLRSAKRYAATLTPEVRRAVLTLALALFDEAERRREANDAQQA